MSERNVRVEPVAGLVFDRAAGDRLDADVALGHCRQFPAAGSITYGNQNLDVNYF